MGVGVGLNAPLAILAVDMGRIGGNGGFDLVGRHQPVGDTGKRPAFQLFTPDRPAVGAGTAAMMAHAAITVADDDGIGAAAPAAIARKRVVWGKCVSVRVDIGGRRLLKKQNNNNPT